jgi:hypothetical protein
LTEIIYLTISVVKVQSVSVFDPTKRPLESGLLSIRYSPVGEGGTKQNHHSHQPLSFCFGLFVIFII